MLFYLAIFFHFSWMRIVSGSGSSTNAVNLRLWELFLPHNFRFETVNIYCLYVVYWPLKANFLPWFFSNRVQFCGLTALHKNSHVKEASKLHTTWWKLSFCWSLKFKIKIFSDIIRMPFSSGILLITFIFANISFSFYSMCSCYFSDSKRSWLLVTNSLSMLSPY